MDFLRLRGKEPTMLRGKLVTLRLMEEDDLKKVTDLSNDCGEANEFSDLKLRSLTEVRKRYEEDGWWGERRGLQVITHEAEIVGVICFFEGFAHEDGFEIGYELFRHADRGKGFGTEALRLFSAYLFEFKPIARLHVRLHEDNIASRRIAEKCGYVLEGTFRNFCFERGRHHNDLILALLREECPTVAQVVGSGPSSG
jgi:ribosomal-protein-alanine N-acetyltransferase